MTHRQYAAWHEWLLGEWNIPDRHDYYAMLIAKILLRDDSPGLSKYRIPFEIRRREPERKLTKEEEVEITKATWFAALGINPPGWRDEHKRTE